ncbi:hypothetical protein Cgig2_016007 [Carnegiea gigantea]|uniref:Uncharacterized protein n=1 Tax=Carnegiea gigantea TaxID=171969 RepID=A0A9Q1QLS2_9CARY|nr:hypothetical protein Cgig2_016007 [Carnegiea gigantea]
MDDHTAITPSGKLYMVANYVGAGVVAAFFASLERCSCINLSTSDYDDDEDEEEGMDRSLMFTNSTRHDDGRHALPAPPPSNSNAPTSVDSLPGQPGIILRYLDVLRVKSDGSILWKQPLCDKIALIFASLVPNLDEAGTEKLLVSLGETASEPFNATQHHVQAKPALDTFDSLNFPAEPS